MKDARSSSILKQRGPFKVIVTTITLWSFLFNIIGPDIALLRPLNLVGHAWAVGNLSELTSVGSGRADSPGVFKALNVATFGLPEYLGQIRYSWEPSIDKATGRSSDIATARSSAKTIQPSNNTIVHIQDAHCNYAAQQKIAEIIAHLNREYGAQVINLEGGAKDYDLSIFTNIHDKNIREKVADNFVKEGLVNGAEYFAINNPEKVTLWGIEM